MKTSNDQNSLSLEKTTTLGKKEICAKAKVRTHAQEDFDNHLLERPI